MKEIVLTQGKVTIVNDEDFDNLTSYKWYTLSYVGGKFYAATWINGKHVRMHRMLLPDYDGIDHIDGDGLNNQRQNLRRATQAQNCANRRKRSNTSSQYKGVSFIRDTGRWSAHIKTQGKQTHLGYFSNEEDAALAYNEAALKLFGDYSRLNEVMIPAT